MREGEGVKWRVVRPRYDRVNGLVKPDLLKRKIAVVGCGTTGSWLAHDLLRMGFEDVTVFDFDHVAAHNLPAQLHMPHEGKSKVESFKECVEMLGIPVPKVVQGSIPDKGNFETVFSCVDSHNSRRQIAETIDGRKTQLIDIRMSWEGACVVFSPPVKKEAYMESLKRDTPDDTACGQRALITTAHAIVGIALGHWIAVERHGFKLRFGGHSYGPGYYNWGWGPAKGVKRMRERIRIDLRTGMTFEEKENEE